jgi:hypothetical protein
MLGMIRSSIGRDHDTGAVPTPHLLPESLPPGGFSVEQATRSGVSRARMRSSDLDAPFHAVRTVGVATGVRAHAVAYSARMAPTQLFSHGTAAELHHLRMPESFRSTSLHVTSLAPARPARGAGVTGHISTRVEAELVEGLRVTSPIATWLHLGSELSVDDLVVMGDGLIRRKEPLCSMAELHRAVASHSGRGCRKLRAAAELVRPGTDSARETMLRLLVVRAGFPEPEVNGVIRNSYGAEIAHGDLVFRHQHVVLEYEGRQHSENTRQFAIDIARLDELMEERWRVIRIDKALMARPVTLFGKLDRALRDGGREFGNSSR